MKKKLLISFVIISSLLFLSGCDGEKDKVETNEEIQFSINDFKEGILENYDSKSDLKIESRYAIGYMYAESFSCDETGTLTNGELKVSGRAFDPADFGDESVLNGRLYDNTINKNSNMNLELSNGSKVDNFYAKYFNPLNIDLNEYEFDDIDENNGQITYAQTDVQNSIENGQTIFIYDYIYYYFVGDKRDYSISRGEINEITIKSYNDISDKMDEFMNAEFGSRFILADTINQTLGEDFLKGIYLVDEFMADFK